MRAAGLLCIEKVGALGVGVAEAKTSQPCNHSELGTIQTELRDSYSGMMSHSSTKETTVNY
jgi:hypothetical protein